MRISDRGLAAGAVLLLAACSDPGSQTANTQVLADVEATQRRDAADDGRIPCAHGAAALRRACTVEQAAGPRGLVLTVRHDDDGGFHRLLVTRDGRGVVAADGADVARVTVTDPQSIDVAIGQDRYRLPATVKPR